MRSRPRPIPQADGWGAAAFCDHQFVVRSYYRRVYPGLLRRHVRWYFRCAQCHAVIGNGPVPSTWTRLDRKRLRVRARVEKAELRILATDQATSGKSWNDYREQLYAYAEAVWQAELMEWQPEGQREGVGGDAGS